MFGHVQANLADLSEEEKKRYRAAYCGLCHTLGKRYGFWTRMALTYDLTFLSLLLSSLYEPEEAYGNCRCIVHPCKKHCHVSSPCTEYAADMTIALMYYKCLDDWQDDKRLSAWLVAKYLQKKYERVKQLWPEQCNIIEQELTHIAKAEADPEASADDAANSFGRLMAGLFVYKKDMWQKSLECLGYGLGRFIYFADAAIDYKRDKRKGSYNPLLKLEILPENLQPSLKMLMGDASQAFEFLPLVQDAHLLKNILYSGIWINYDRAMRKKRKKDD